MGEPGSEPVPTHADQKAEERVRGILAGDRPSTPLRWMRRIFRRLPSDPRCQLCYAPYAAPFGPLLGRLGFGRWEKNPSLCGSCLHLLERYHTGAEIELSMVFADLRGSTEMAARMSPSAYSRLVNAFYGIAAHAIQAPGGHVDKYLGDGVFALFIPGFVGSDHAIRAIAAARGILAGTADAASLPEAERPLPVGVGVHTGAAYVGVLGRVGDLTDFTALGDAVNITQRLSSGAAAREILISDAALTASGIDSSRLHRRELRLKGVADPVTAWSETDAQSTSARTQAAPRDGA